MKWGFRLLVMLITYSSAMAYGQETGVCKVATEPSPQLQGLTALTDYDVAPMELLFSDQGVNVYSATSYRRPHPMQWISENGLTVILVFETETARQKEIAHLQGNSSLPARIGFPQHIENLKYAMLNLFGPSEGFVRDLEFFQPKQCVTAEQVNLAVMLWLDYSDRTVWDMPGLHATTTGPNWITGFSAQGFLLPAGQNPFYLRIRSAMLRKVQSYVAAHPEE